MQSILLSYEEKSQLSIMTYATLQSTLFSNGERSLNGKLSVATYAALQSTLLSNEMSLDAQCQS